MFTTVAINIGKLLIAYLSLIVGFSMAFAVLFPSTYVMAYMPYALITTFVMMTGEVEYENRFFQEKDVLRYVGTTHLVFLAFLLFIVVVLMNLLVGLAVSDIQGLQKSAGLDRLVRQTRLIARMEGIIFSPWIIKSIPYFGEKLTRRFLERKILLVPLSNQRRIYCVRPNDPRDRRFPPDIKENLSKIITTSRSKKPLGLRRTATPMSLKAWTTHDEFDEVISRIDDLFQNYMSQIVSMNTAVDERLSRLESQVVLRNQSVDESETIS